ncbi:MAG TPA: crotonase/enoyl-CoA hydratase family protein [Acidimicrobiales bacterium]|nr:crotonase/enoyl-CoA hydratase family protein [Acidimicrobiales bacterium]
MTVETVEVEIEGPVMVVSIDRPEVRNAVDGRTAEALYEAFSRFESDSALAVAVLTGAGGTFCAGADLKAIGAGRGNRVESRSAESIVGSPGPMGPTRMLLSKPVIAAVEGHAVAGGLELALWCDLRVAAEDAVLGVYCRRWGVPLIDGGNVRLPRLIGHSRAMDMILTGRGVGAVEALEIGLVNRITPPGRAREVAVDLATQIAAFPQRCLRSDRLNAIGQWDAPLGEALAAETLSGLEVIASGETEEGARRFAGGEGRHGSFGP